MKIALFSDIHANLPALDALFQDMDDKKPDTVYCLGDLVGYNIWPNEVIEEIRKRRIPTIAGNYDFGVGRKSDDCGCAYKTDEEYSGMGWKALASGEFKTVLKGQVPSSEGKDNSVDHLF